MASRGACSFRRNLSSPVQRSLPGSVLKRHAESVQESLGFLVRLRSRADDDVHATDLVDLVVVDLREDQLLLEAEGIVAATVEALARNAAEVADARQRDVDQGGEEPVHVLATRVEAGRVGEECVSRWNTRGWRRTEKK